MANPISPGVYTKIQPLETYVQEVPSGSGFIAFLADKGPDNKLIEITSLEKFKRYFGDFNATKYRTFSQGYLVAKNFIETSPKLYVIRPLPNDATYSNLTAIFRIEKPEGTDANGNLHYESEPISVSWQNIPLISDENTLDAVSITQYTKEPVLLRDLTDGKVYRLDIGADLGGMYEVAFIEETSYDMKYVKDYIVVWDRDTSAYRIIDKAGNDLAGITPNDNKEYHVIINNQIHRLEVYTDTNGIHFVWAPVPSTVKSRYDYEEPILSFYGTGRGEWYNNIGISIDTFANNTNYIILNTYEKQEIEVQTGSYNISTNPDSYDPNTNQSLFIKDVLEDNIDLNVGLADYNQVLTDVVNILDVNKLYTEVDGIIFSIQDAGGLTGTYFIANRPGGWLTSYQGNILENLDVDNQTFNTQTPIDYGTIIKDKSTGNLYIHTEYGLLYEFDPFLYSLLTNYTAITGIHHLGNGSDGSLITSTGTVDATVATTLLIQAYKGEIDNQVKNTDLIWFDLVLDAGYPKDVKDAIVELTSVLRRDCICLLDNGDNKTPQEAIKARLEDHYYSTEYAAIYEPYIQIRNPNGKNMWVTPIYAVGALFAANDKINDVWYAVAGYRRGINAEIKDLRYSPLLSERDDFYLNQINPFVKFKEGKVLWGQLTTRRIPDPLQDINVIRTVLYCKRAIENYLKFEIFELLDSETLQRMESAIKKFLLSVQRRRGLYGFSVEVKRSDTNPKTAVVNIILEPTRAMEKILLNFFIK